MTVGRLGTKSSASQRLCDANMAVQLMAAFDARVWTKISLLADYYT